MVSVQSVHAFWSERKYPFSVDSRDDESPQFRVRVTPSFKNVVPSSVRVTYVYDAPRELVSHAFHIKLNCFWGLDGCRSARQMSPELSRDSDAIDSATISRLHDGDPCPARVLAARKRYLLDINVFLLEAKKARAEEVNEEGERRTGFVANYKLKEIIRGDSNQNALKGIQWSPLIPAPLNPLERIANPLSPPKLGDHVLLFTGERFSSCRFVPATPPTVAAVRGAIPAPKRPEDQFTRGGLQ